jgi:two-component system cell cycle response regulator DivK
MPVFDGIYATRQIRANPELKHIPIIAVTSYSSDFNHIALAAGCNQVFSKPTLI